MPVPYSFDHCSFVIYFENGSSMPSVLFFLKIALAIWSLLWFHVHLGLLFSITVKNDIGILIDIALSL